MDVELSLNKNLEKNAAHYFEAAKKAKKKLDGLKKAMKELEQKKTKLDATEIKEIVAKKSVVKKAWYEKFRWFISSDGFLVVGGRDATTNEILIKKYTDPKDLVFHTELPGSPFVVIKSEGKEISSLAKEEAAQFCGIYSKLWKEGTLSGEVYAILPEQVSKEAKAGEYLAKGSFMIYGKRTYFKPVLSLGLGMYEGKVMAGPLSAVKKNCDPFVEVVQGTEKISDLGKKIRHFLKGDLDEIIRGLPPGSMLKK